MHGEIAYDEESGTATWKGTWAGSLEDLNSRDEKKISPFSFEGKKLAKGAAADGGSNAAAKATDATQEDESLSSSKPPSSGAGTSGAGAGAGGVAEEQGNEQDRANRSSKFPELSWSGHIKYRRLDKIQSIKEHIDSAIFTPEGGSGGMSVVFKGDNKFGRFSMFGSVTGFDAKASKASPVRMNLERVYHEFWSPTNKRPARKRAASSSLSPEERENMKRMRTAKAYKNLTGSVNEDAVSADAARASGRRIRKPKKLREPQQLRKEVPSHLPKWAKICWELLEDLREFDEKTNKIKKVAGLFFKSVSDDPSVPSDFFNGTYVPALKSQHTYPIDLGSVRRSLQSQKYESHHEFAAEVRRVFHNAFAYWIDYQGTTKTAPIPLAAAVLSKKFESMYNPIVTKEILEQKRKEEKAEKKRKMEEERMIKRQQEKEKKERQRLLKKQREEAEKERRARARQVEKEKKKRQKEAERKRRAKEKAEKKKRKRNAKPSGRRQTEQERRLAEQQRQLEEQLRVLRDLTKGMGRGILPTPHLSHYPGDRVHHHPEDPQGRAPKPQKAPRVGSPMRKDRKKKKVTKAAKEKCIEGLKKVAPVYQEEFMALANKLKIVSDVKTGDGQTKKQVNLNMHKLPDEDAKTLIDFVKRKLRAIQKEKMKKKDRLGLDDVSVAAAEKEAEAGKRENALIDEQLHELQSKRNSIVEPTPSQNHGVVFDSDDEDDDSYGGYNPFASSADRRPSTVSNWGDPKALKEADDRRRQAAAHASEQVAKESRQEFEAESQNVREQARIKEGERIKQEKRAREEQAKKDREREEHRRQQQNDRDALANRDSFHNHEAEDDYDPYSFGFGDE